MDIREDTIVARATATGESAIAIVRLSGPKAVSIADSFARTERGQSLEEAESHRVMFRYIIDPSTKNVIDEALVFKMDAPHSYTGEDMVEINCHGGSAIVRRIIELALEKGARLAEPGEFTRRAFMNGRIDLVQAEAVADLVAAKTEQARQLAMRQLRGDLSGKLNELRETLLDVAAEIEARIDFPEEEIPPTGKHHLITLLKHSVNVINELIEAGERGRVIRDGARIILVGKPNTGKSSLFNALLRKERAIVTPHPGTTRDTIESIIDLKGIPLTLVDTAGMRAARDEIEAIGIDRTKEEIHQADLIVVLFDKSEALQFEDAELWKLVRQRDHLVVLTKNDLEPAINKNDLQSTLNEFPGNEEVVDVSAIKRQNLNRLEDALFSKLVKSETLGDEGLLVSNLRHITELKIVRSTLKKTVEGIEDNRSGDLIMIDLNEGLTHLGDILGVEVGGEILGRIFARFCIGK